MTRSTPIDVIPGYNSLSNTYITVRAAIMAVGWMLFAPSSLYGFYAGEFLAGLELGIIAFLFMVWGIGFLPLNNRVRMRNTWISSWMNK